MKAKVKVKALSVNKLYRGRRFRTPEYDTYEQEVMWQLPPAELIGEDLTLKLTVGLSNANADLSNTVKAIEDIAQKKYGFNDKHINHIEMHRDRVKKGFEYVDIEIIDNI